MKRISTLMAVTLFIGLSSCSLFQRHPKSGYYNQIQGNQPDEALNFYQLQQYHKKQKALEEMGINPTQPLDRSQQTALKHRLQLKRMEAAIPTQKERRQYYRYKAFLSNDLNRIKFLQIPTFEDRTHWVNKLGISDSNSQKHSKELIQIIENNDIVVGMSKKEVAESWGNPDTMEIAGNPIYRNERWRYTKHASSANGYRKEIRLIYFEGGRVVGWETF